MAKRSTQQFVLPHMRPLMYGAQTDNAYSFTPMQSKPTKQQNVLIGAGEMEESMEYMKGYKSVKCTRMDWVALAFMGMIFTIGTGICFGYLLFLNTGHVKTETRTITVNKESNIAEYDRKIKECEAATSIDQANKIKCPGGYQCIYDASFPFATPPGTNPPSARCVMKCGDTTIPNYNPLNTANRYCPDQKICLHHSDGEDTQKCVDPSMIPTNDGALLVVGKGVRCQDRTQQNPLVALCKAPLVCLPESTEDIVYTCQDLPRLPKVIDNDNAPTCADDDGTVKRKCHKDDHCDKSRTKKCKKGRKIGRKCDPNQPNQCEYGCKCRLPRDIADDSGSSDPASGDQHFDDPASGDQHSDDPTSGDQHFDDPASGDQHHEGSDSTGDASQDDENPSNTDGDSSTVDEEEEEEIYPTDDATHRCTEGVDEGEPCGYFGPNQRNVVCRDSNNFCAYTSTDEITSYRQGICTQFASTGQHCEHPNPEHLTETMITAEHLCNPKTHFCDTSSHCKELRGQGSGCTTTLECEPQLYCVTRVAFGELVSDNTHNTCQPRITLEEYRTENPSCVVGNYGQCPDDFSCMRLFPFSLAGNCVRGLLPGDRCMNERGKFNRNCIPDGNTIGREFYCSPDTQKCTTVENSCTSSDFCGRDQTCININSDENPFYTCVNAKSRGSCSSDYDGDPQYITHQCVSGYLLPRALSGDKCKHRDAIYGLETQCIISDLIECKDSKCINIIESVGSDLVDRIQPGVNKLYDTIQCASRGFLDIISGFGNFLSQDIAITYGEYLANGNNIDAATTNRVNTEMDYIRDRGVSTMCDDCDVHGTYMCTDSGNLVE